MRAKRIMIAAAVISALCVPAFASGVSEITVYSNPFATSMQAPNPPKPAPAPQQPAPQKPQPPKPGKKSIVNFNNAQVVELKKKDHQPPPPPPPQPPRRDNGPHHQAPPPHR